MKLCLPALSCAALLAIQTLALAGTPAYSTAPGTPICTAGDPDNTVVCSWSSDGLSPTPAKYAVQVLAGYDPDCDDDFDVLATIRSTTAEPTFSIAATALDRTVCTSAGSSCTTTATFHAKSVQVRVKALNPPGGSQNNPFSALSAPLAVLGVCEVCPSACVSRMDAVLAIDTRLHQLDCGLDPNRGGRYLQYAALFNFDDSVAAQIVDNRCFADIAGDTSSGALTNVEQDACARRYAPLFEEKASRACDDPQP